MTSLPVPPRSRWVSAIGLRTSQQGDAGQGHRRTADGFRKEEGHRQSDKEKVRCHQSSANRSPQCGVQGEEQLHWAAQGGRAPSSKAPSSWNPALTSQRLRQGPGPGLAHLYANEKSK